MLTGNRPALGLAAWPRHLYTFVCQQCLKPGTGQVNQTTHAGECRKLRQIELNRQSDERRKARRLKAKGAGA